MTKFFFFFFLPFQTSNVSVDFQIQIKNNIYSIWPFALTFFFLSRLADFQSSWPLGWDGANVWWVVVEKCLAKLFTQRMWNLTVKNMKIKWNIRFIVPRLSRPVLFFPTPRGEWLLSHGTAEVKPSAYLCTRRLRIL